MTLCSTSVSLVVFQGQQGQAIGVLVVAVLHAVEETDHGHRHEHQAHEDLDDQDVHAGASCSFGAVEAARRSRASQPVVASKIARELAGMATAAPRGVASPSIATVTAATL